MSLAGDIRAALVAALDEIEVPGMEDFQTSKYVMTSPIPPLIEIDLGPDEAVDYDQTGARGSDQWLFTVRALVGTSTSEGSQEIIDDLLEPAGPSSVKAAIESDLSLNGLVQTLRVTQASGRKEFAVSGVADVYLGCEWTVALLASGT